ncbi:MAG: NAD(P)/FAD-dependent oxidoreductase [Desulforhopalus sp.]
MKKRLLLLGGGHAHMVTLANLHKFVATGIDVTVVQPSQYHYYSGMGPGMLGGTYVPDDIRFATRRLVEGKGGRFILGKASRIDPFKQLVSLDNTDEKLHYDVLSCNVGSSVPHDIIATDSDNVFTAKPIEKLFAARQKILELAAQGEVSVGVIGGGPSAIEISGNIHQLGKDQEKGPVTVRMFGGHSLMAGRPERVRRLTKMLLGQKGIKIIEGDYVRKVDSNIITLESGEKHRADIIFPALGVRPSDIFKKSDLPTGPDGGLEVNEFLQCTRHENIFGGGDCIYFAKQPLDKVGVYAVRQNPVLYANLMASLQGQPLEKFSPGGSYLLIYNLGDGKGVLSKWSLTFAGRLAFLIKDYIDRKFIRTFQES